MKLPIYFDYSATCPVDPRVAEKMVQCMTMDGNFGNPASRSHRYGWQAEESVDNAREQPQVLVHRDYHSRNLMHLSSRNPGVLDFQDAVIGPITYDLVSLLRDCYITLSSDLVELLFDKFYENLNEKIRNRYSKNRFIRFFDLMGIQRHLKAIGIFSRLNYRDGKQNYLKDIPRTLNYIYRVSENYKELNFLRELIANIK